MHFVGPYNIGVKVQGSCLAVGDQRTVCQCPITVWVIFALKLLEPDPARQKFLWVYRLDVQDGLSVMLYHWVATARRPRVPHIIIWGSSGSVFWRYSVRASIQPTSYADHVPVVSSGEFRSAVACVSVEITV